MRAMLIRHSIDERCRAADADADYFDADDVAAALLAALIHYLARCRRCEFIFADDAEICSLRYADDIADIDFMLMLMLMLLLVTLMLILIISLPHIIAARCAAARCYAIIIMLTRYT